MLVGYGRTSTVDQAAGIEAQERDLRAAGCEKLFVEQVSSGRNAASPGRWCQMGDPAGWCCWTCHPPDHQSADAVIEVKA